MRTAVPALVALAAALAGATAIAPAASARRGSRLPKAVVDADYRNGGRPDAAKVELGRLLFHDKVLSGNRTISCATCHHSLCWTGDGLSLPVGEGGSGLGVARNCGTGPNAIAGRVPRNAPPLFNLGAKAMGVLLHDGGVENDLAAPFGWRTPAGDDLPAGLDDVLAAHAMFPVASAVEMAGQPGENEVADAAAAGKLAGPGGVWDLLAQRLRAIPEYMVLFRAAFPAIVSDEDVTFVRAANAIAAFESAAWRSDGSPFDLYLRGERSAMTAAQKKGMKLFYGKAGCATCHAGPFQTDLAFHAIAMPQIGPGKGDGASQREDFGRERVTGDAADRYRFRTPPLRNVVLSGPWGHDGAYDSLEAVVRHHLGPAAALAAYDRTQAVLPPRPDLDAQDFTTHDDPAVRAAILAAADVAPVRLKDRDVAYVVEFLRALTDPRMIDLRRHVPSSVPSGLPVAD